jgi:hypothetical protein
VLLRRAMPKGCVERSGIKYHIYCNKITTCKEGKLYEYEYVLPDDTLVGTSRPDHATVGCSGRVTGTQTPIVSLRPIARFFVDRYNDGGLT